MVGSIFRPYLFLFGGVPDSQWIYICEFMRYYWYYRGRQFGVTETTTLEDRGMRDCLCRTCHSQSSPLRLRKDQARRFDNTEDSRVTALQPIKAGAYLVLRASGAVTYLIMSSSMTYVMYFLSSTRAASDNTT
ncbi:hypothetical protein F5051DRAFT_420310 [Lentinula edodes]|nr:hypothetical protein F5051DRAFT_420310 [Lentinula edodes]